MSELRDETEVNLWTDQVPKVVHLIGGEDLYPHPETYVAWSTGDGGVHTLRWVEGGRWRVVPGSAIAYMDFAKPDSESNGGSDGPSEAPDRA